MKKFIRYGSRDDRHLKSLARADQLRVDQRTANGFDQVAPDGRNAFVALDKSRSVGNRPRLKWLAKNDLTKPSGLQ
jgi:hypothetical protein